MGVFLVWIGNGKWIGDGKKYSEGSDLASVRLFAEGAGRRYSERGGMLEGILVEDAIEFDGFGFPFEGYRFHFFAGEILADHGVVEL